MLTVSMERMVPMTPWPWESTLPGFGAAVEPPVIQFRKVPWNNGRPAMSCAAVTEVEGCEGCSGGKDEQSRQGSVAMDTEPVSNEESGEEDVQVEFVEQREGRSVLSCVVTLSSAPTAALPATLNSMMAGVPEGHGVFWTHCAYSQKSKRTVCWCRQFGK